MREDADRTDTDEEVEGYANKERQGSYAVAILGLLAFVAIAVVMVMQHMDLSLINYPNIEPSSGFSPVK